MFCLFGRCIVTNVCIFKLLSSKCTRDTAIEKEFDIAKQIKLDMSEIQENKNGQKKSFNKGIQILLSEQIFPEE